MTKKLYRARKDKIIGGVCGGIANYFEIDSTWIRLAFLLLIIARGEFFIAYLIAWIIIPESPLIMGYRDNEEDSYNQEEEEFRKEKMRDQFNHEFSKENSNNKQGQKILGIILVFLGGIFLIDNWFPYYHWERFWPLLIIVLGIGLLVKGVNKRG